MRSITMEQRARTVLGLLLILAFPAALALFLGYMIPAQAAVNPAQQGISQTESAQPQVINGKIILMCVQSTKDLLYIYQNLKGEPVGIAVVSDGCNEN